MKHITEIHTVADLIKLLFTYRADTPVQLYNVGECIREGKEHKFEFTCEIYPPEKGSKKLV